MATNLKTTNKLLFIHSSYFLFPFSLVMNVPPSLLPDFVLPCPRPVELLHPSLEVVSGEFPRCAGTAGTDPKHQELADPSNLNL